MINSGIIQNLWLIGSIVLVLAVAKFVGKRWLYGLAGVFVVLTIIFSPWFYNANYISHFNVWDGSSTYERPEGKVLPFGWIKKSFKLSGNDCFAGKSSSSRGYPFNEERYIASCQSELVNSFAPLFNLISPQLLATLIVGAGTGVHFLIAGRKRK